MGDKTYMIPPIGGKSILRRTGEEVEIIDFETKERGDRNDEDWVTYIDSNGKEHIKESLNIQLDFKSIVNDTWSKVFDFAKSNKMPTTRNCRIFEAAKEIYLNFRLNFRDFTVDEAVEVATKLVDKVGIEVD